MVMLDAAESAGVEHFVFVSTDKAVRPSSVMGASKRIAEMLVAEAALRTGRPFVSVRFGNVLGSTGSVVPILREQLETGEPLTITHPDMTRFFMTIPEASSLILDAAALGRGADLFVLDMGEPIRVLDLARDLVKLAGRDPDSQPIEIIGMRPGEKLHEELFYDAELVETTSSKVLRARTTPPPSTIREDACEMLVMATGGRARPSTGDPRVRSRPEGHPSPKGTRLSKDPRSSTGTRGDPGRAVGVQLIANAFRAPESAHWLSARANVGRARSPRSRYGRAPPRDLGRLADPDVAVAEPLGLPDRRAGLGLVDRVAGRLERGIAMGAPPRSRPTLRPAAPPRCDGRSRAGRRQTAPEPRRRSARGRRWPWARAPRIRAI